MSALLPRRRFLQASAGGLCLGFLAGCGLPVIPKRPAPKGEDAAGWIRHDGQRYTLWIPRVEMGQAVSAALATVAATELGMTVDALTVQLHHTGAINRVRATVGSDSIKDFALPLAQACATLREAVAQGLNQAQLVPRERPLAELRWWQAQAPAPTAGRARAPLYQAHEIVTGQPLFAGDVRLPGMVFGRVLRAPASPELRSQPSRWNDAAARATAGFVALVEDQRLQQANSLGIGIVARTPAALDAVARALDVQWAIQEGAALDGVAAQIDIDRRLREPGSLSNAVHKDTIDDAGTTGTASRTTDKTWDVDLRLDIPAAAHAPIEPRCAVAQPTDGPGLRLWVGTQDVFYQRDVISQRLGLDDSRVQVHGQRVGGAFGGKTVCTVELEAALLAMATQLPVKVQWTREQEFAQGFHRPPTSHRIRARLRDGRLDTWWHGFASSHILFTNAVLPPWLQRITDVIGDDGVARGAALPYRCRAKRTEFDLVRLPLLTGPWRGLGAGPNGLATESAIDECAWRAGADPLAFRLAQLDDARLKRCLERVAAAAGWTAAPPATPDAALPPRLRGRGVACGIYKQASYAAVVADVEVDSDSGAVRVTKLWCAHDCGRVVLADQVRAQCEGNLVWGLGMVLHEQLPLGRLAVAATNLADFPLPRLADVPPIETVLVDGGDAPTGAGETAIVAAGAAMANALRAATGVRFGRFPVTSADVLNALAPRASAAPRKP